MRFIRNERGLTLVELLVTMGLMAVISLVITTALITTNHVIRHNDDENQGLADAKVVSERLARDLRDARGIATGADQHHLVMWIDFNSDYIQQSSETVTWQLQADATSPGHFDVTRTVQGQTQVVEARTLINDLAFSYSPTPPSTELVATTMTYDALLGGASQSRQVTFSARLRNAR